MILIILFPLPLWHFSLNGHPSQLSHWYLSTVLLSIFPAMAVSLSLINFLLLGQIMLPSSSLLKLTLLKISSWNFLSCVSLFHKGYFIYISILLFSQYLYVSRFPYPASATGYFGYSPNIFLYFSISGIKQVLSEADWLVNPNSMYSLDTANCQLYAGSSAVFPI